MRVNSSDTIFFVCLVFSFFYVDGNFSKKKIEILGSTVFFLANLLREADRSAAYLMITRVHGPYVYIYIHTYICMYVLCTCVYNTNTNNNGRNGDDNVIGNVHSKEL